MWSTVAKVRCGNLHLQAEIAQHAEGLRAGHLVDEVRPMKSCVWPFGSVRTVCASQTFSKRLFPMVNATF